MPPNNHPRDCSPSTMFRRKSVLREGRFVRFKMAASNWLNGLPIAEDDEEEAADVDVEAGKEEDVKSLLEEKEKGDKEDCDQGQAPSTLRRRKSTSLSKTGTIGKLKKFITKRFTTNRHKQDNNNNHSNDVDSEAPANTKNDSVDDKDIFSTDDNDKGVEDNTGPIIPAIPPAKATKRKAVRIIQMPPLPLDLLLMRAQENPIDDTIQTTDNEIKTAKYTLLTFLPKNIIMEQMRRVANIYFVLIVFLQYIPAISNYSPILTAMPIVMILAVTAIKDAIEDWKRHGQDNQVNYSRCLSLQRSADGEADAGQVEGGGENVRGTIKTRIRFWSAKLAGYFHHALQWIQWRWRQSNFRDSANAGDAQNRLSAGSEADPETSRLERGDGDKAATPPSFDHDHQEYTLPKLPPGTIGWKQTFWRDLRVGDLCLLHNNEHIPADLLLLNTSESDGICFIETKNLDGESNLKIKQSPPDFEWIKSAEDAAALKATVEVDLPNNLLYSFCGKIIVCKDLGGSPLPAASQSSSAGAEMEEGAAGCRVGSEEDLKIPQDSSDNFIETNVIPVNNDGVLLRGCTLRNTEWVIGLVVYGGVETKLMKNTGLTPSKRTRIERQLNPQIIINFLLLFAICLACAIVQGGAGGGSGAPWLVKSFTSLERGGSGGSAWNSGFLLGFLTFWSCVILFQTLVPISMYVAVEIVKTAQAFFINEDALLYHGPSDMRAIPRAWNLADDLGQIEYVFSDKTGTLTENVMEFRQCSIGGRVYGRCVEGADEGENALFLNGEEEEGRRARSIPSTPTTNPHAGRDQEVMIKRLQALLPYPYVPPMEYSFVDSGLFDDLMGISCSGPSGASGPGGNGAWGGISEGVEKRKQIVDFFVVLSVCHTVLVDDEGGEGGEGDCVDGDNADEQSCVSTPNTLDPTMTETLLKEPSPSNSPPSPSSSLDSSKNVHLLTPHTLHYKAQSPDEAALVSASRHLGFSFLNRNRNIVKISILGEIERIVILHVLEFTSERGRMSVVVRRADGRIQLLCKGADNVIMARLSHEHGDDSLPSAAVESDDLGKGDAGERDSVISSNSNAKKRLLKDTRAHLESFAEQGLRTLCLAQRDIPSALYHSWCQEYADACMSMQDRDHLIARASDQIETNMELLGATAIEDCLQAGVPECIYDLRSAGIRVWVLTGDKVETAINIGFSCRLLEKDMTLLVVRGGDGDAENCREQLMRALERIWSEHFDYGKFDDDYTATHSNTSDHNGNATRNPPSGNSAHSQQFALIIDGEALKWALEGSCKRLFVDLATQCASVLCCRASPLQKARVVSLIKRSQNAITLAIGDGANDVSMIQAAHIGIGISGQEGMQAVMSSDYAIAQFRHLTRLLLVHGRWSYRRVALVTLLSLYKNLAFVVLLFWFQFLCGFSAQYVYDYMFLLFFNMFFSIGPLMAIGFFDRDVESETATVCPPIYHPTRPLFSFGAFLWMMGEGVWHSLVCFWVPVWVLGDVALSADGVLTESLSSVGSVMAISIISTVNFYMAFQTMAWPWPVPFALLSSLLTVWAFFIVYSLLPGVGGMLMGEWRLLLIPSFWASIIACVVVSMGSVMLVEYALRWMHPHDLDIVREREKLLLQSSNDISAAAAATNEDMLERLLYNRDLQISGGNFWFGGEKRELIGQIPCKEIKMPPPLHIRPNYTDELALIDEDGDRAISRRIMIPSAHTLPSHNSAHTQPHYSSPLSGPPAPLPPKRKRKGKRRKLLKLLNMATDRYEIYSGYAFSQGHGGGKLRFDVGDGSEGEGEGGLASLAAPKPVKYIQ